MDRAAAHATSVNQVQTIRSFVLRRLAKSLRVLLRIVGERTEHDVAKFIMLEVLFGEIGSLLEDNDTQPGARQRPRDRATREPRSNDYEINIGFWCITSRRRITRLHEHRRGRRRRSRRTGDVWRLTIVVSEGRCKGSAMLQSDEIPALFLEIPAVLGISKAGDDGVRAQRAKEWRLLDRREYCVLLRFVERRKVQGLRVEFRRSGLQVLQAVDVHLAIVDQHLLQREIDELRRVHRRRVGLIVDGGDNAVRGGLQRAQLRRREKSRWRRCASRLTIDSEQCACARSREQW